MQMRRSILYEVAQETERRLSVLFLDEKAVEGSEELLLSHKLLVLLVI